MVELSDDDSDVPIKPVNRLRTEGWLQESGVALHSRVAWIGAHAWLCCLPASLLY